jgi:hypothetical protein
MSSGACAMTPGGKRKEHYLEPLRAAELDRLHAKTAEPTMEQYIEIDDELPELTEVTGTSSPMPTLTSASTWTSSSSSDRRKTRRQTRMDSYARLPVTMPSSSEEDEPVAQAPRSGRRAKKSLSTGSA